MCPWRPAQPEAHRSRVEAHTIAVGHCGRRVLPTFLLGTRCQAWVFDPKHTMGPGGWHPVMLKCRLQPPSGSAPAGQLHLCQDRGCQVWGVIRPTTPSPLLSAPWIPTRLCGAFQLWIKHSILHRLVVQAVARDEAKQIHTWSVCFCENKLLVLSGHKVCPMVTKWIQGLVKKCCPIQGSGLASGAGRADAG